MEELVRDMILSLLFQFYGEASMPTPAGMIDCSGNWRIYDFREEIQRYIGSPYNESLPEEDLLVFLDRAGIAHPQKINKCFIARALYSHVVRQIKGPAFLRNLPAAQSPLFQLNEDGSTLDETVLVINGTFVADIVNPERDPRILRRRMEEQLAYRKEGENNCVNEDLICATGFGLPPCRGFGIGIERLLMLLLNAGDVRDVDLFPAF
jgi:lysyl-tRNA synthetase class 2